MKILLGTHEIGRHVYDLADGFRELGHEADTIMAFRNPHLPELQYSFLYDQRELAEFVQAIQTKRHLHDSEPMRLLQSLLSDYDVYVFNFASSLLPANTEFPYLKDHGKKIVCLYQGSDIRHWSGAEPVAEQYGYSIPSMYRTSPYDNLTHRLHNLRMGERYADAVFSLPFQSELAVRPYHHILIPVNLSLYEEKIPARDIPVLVHAPTRRNFKGTDVFLEVLDRLKGEGIAFELKLLEKVPNQEVIRMLVDADVVLDELNAPHYGMLALEGMATGCVVVAGCERGYVPLQGDSPVFTARPENLYDRLKLLLTDKAVRLHHARRGRAFVEAQHDHVRVAARVLSKLEPDGGAPEYYPTFYATRYSLPEGDVVPENLKEITAQIIQQWGLPAGSSVRDLVHRGLSAELAPGRPVVNWKPANGSVKAEIWGWSPEHVDEAILVADQPAGIIVHLAQLAIQAVMNKDHATAGTILQECIAYAAEHPEAFTDVDATVAIGRLAQELGELELAAGLFSQAHLQAPERADLLMAADMLRSDPGIAA